MKKVCIIDGIYGMSVSSWMKNINRDISQYYNTWMLTSFAFLYDFFCLFDGDDCFPSTLGNSSSVENDDWWGDVDRLWNK